MTAVYPRDAVFDVNSFSTVSSTEYLTTGSTTEFVLPTPVQSVGQVLAFSDGVMQDPTTYDLEASDGVRFSNVVFTESLFANVLTLKVISVPNYFYVNRYNLNTAVLTYNNAPQTVRANSYNTNGSRKTFALPVTSVSAYKESVLVFRSGLAQSTNDFTFPSATLNIYGIDMIEAPASDETLEIRVFDTSTGKYYRSTSMEDRKADKGFSYTREVMAKKTAYIAGYEKRRLISRRMKRKWTFGYKNLNGIQKQAIENFYLARSGDYEAFSFDLSHLNEQGLITVTFETPPNVTHVLSGNPDDLSQNYYDITMNFREVDD